MNKPKSTLLFSHLGFWSAFVGYTFHPLLGTEWFFYLISLAFVFYTLALRVSSSGRWYWIPLICSTNAMIDEVRFTATVLDWSEYVSFILILLVIFVERKRAIQNIIGLLMYLKKL